MHYERQKLMAVTEYIPPKPAVNPRCLTPPSRPSQEETGLIRLLRREIAAVFRDNRMIAICQNVALSAEDKLLMRHRLRKHNILMKVFPNQVLKPFLEDSKYKKLLPLFVGHNLLLVSEEPKVKEMVRILKGVPFLPLLGEQAPLPIGGEAKGPESTAPFVEGCLCLLTPVLAPCPASPAWGKIREGRENSTGEDIQTS
uniref:Large ribosomal subunit protein uL10m n=1 Tax=Molossus molossus TaxID=27622 RepID=A0A7J8D011_MOLMO|nr:mitochondrial ribosomal protein L10 [Molossus molossus]